MNSNPSIRLFQLWSEPGLFGKRRRASQAVDHVYVQRCIRHVMISSAVAGFLMNPNVSDVALLNPHNERQKLPNQVVAAGCANYVSVDPTGQVSVNGKSTEKIKMAKFLFSEMV